MKIAIESLKERTMEWFSASVMLAWGASFALPGDLLSKPDFVGFHRFGTSDAFWACAFSIVGVAGLVALYINGRWPRGPIVRVARALFGLFSWSQIAYLFLEASVTNHTPVGTGPFVYGLLALFEVVSINKAAFDARYHHP